MEVNLAEMYWDEEMIDIAEEVIKSGRYVKGPGVERLEENFSNFCETENGVTFNSGTSALLASYYSLGISEGDDVIVPSFTFAATVTPLLFLDANPVFVDIDEETYTMDVESVKEKITDDTKAIVPVHLYGHPADMEPLKELANDHDAELIEDACQAHGAEYKGEKVGSWGDVGCFSFFPSKNLTVSGEGGIAVTDDDELAEKLKRFRDHGRGKDDKYMHRSLGLNLRLSEILALLGNHQLEELSNWNENRREIARIYRENLNGEVIVPREKNWAKHVYHLFVIKSEEREKLQNYLSERGISTGIHYPIPVHKQPVLKDKNDIELPVTEEMAEKVLSLPMYPGLEKEKIRFICGKLNDFEG